jgi:hypothetical protein
VLAALRLASTRRVSERGLDTLTLLIALESVDSLGDWARVVISDVQQRDPDGVSDDTWEGVPLSRHCAEALSRARVIAEAYDLVPLPAGALALALVWDGGTGAARSIVGTAHESLIAEIQQDILGVELVGLRELLTAPLAQHATDGEHVDSQHREEKRDPSAEKPIPTTTLDGKTIYQRHLRRQVPARLLVAGIIVAEAIMADRLWMIPLAVVPLLIGYPLTPSWVFLVPAGVAAGVHLEASAWFLVAEAGILTLSERRLVREVAAKTVYADEDAIATPVAVRRLASALLLSQWKVGGRQYWSRATVLIGLWFWLPHHSLSLLTALLTLAIAVFACIRGLRLLAVLAAVSAFLLGESLVITGVGIVGGILIIVAQRFWVRAPAHSLPVPSVSAARLATPLGRRLNRLDRLLRRDRADLAVELSDPHDPLNTMPEVLTRRALGLLRSGDPAAAREVARQVIMDTTSQGVRDSAACIEALTAIELSDLRNIDAVTTVYSRMVPGVESHLRTEAALVHAAAFLTTGDSAAAQILDGIMPHIQASGDEVQLARAMRLRASCFIEALPRLGLRLLDDALDLLGGLGKLDSDDEDVIFGVSRAIGTEVGLCQIDRAAFAVVLGRVDEDLSEVLGLSGGVAEWMMRVGRPLDAVKALRLQAQSHEQLGDFPEALTSWTSALSLLEAVRYRMRHQGDRVTWAVQHGQVLDAALAAAHGQHEWDLIAELMETARLQGLPRSEPVTVAPAIVDHADRSSTLEADGITGRARRAACASVGLLPVSPAPFIRVRGRSTLESVSLHAESDQPAALNIEEIAATAAGTGAWWWGTWSTPTFLYWSLVPPTGNVFAGRLHLGDGAPITDLLARMTEALPIQLAGEDDIQIGQRMQRSPLVYGPATDEAALAAALGALLPDSLATELRTRSATSPLQLAIAPALALANVPWPLVGIPATPNLRLIDRASLAMTPSAAMVDYVGRRPSFGDQEPAPVRLAVVDPSGDLPEVRLVLPLLPTAAKVMMRSGATGPTLQDLSRELQALPAKSTVLFACHTEYRVDTPSSGGLRLNNLADARQRVLTSETLLQESHKFPMPCQVLVMACDSGDVGGTTGGEWLTLGPALLWTGADRTVVTSYPVYEYPLVDAELLRRLAAGYSLKDALRETQLSLLDQWRSSDQRSDPKDVLPPILWAAHIAFGVFGSPPPQRTLALLPVRQSALTLLDDAADVAGEEPVAPFHLAAAALLWAEGEEMPIVRLATGISSVALVMLARRLLRRTLRRRNDRHTQPAKDSALALLASAGRCARSAGHAHIAAEHIICSLINNATGVAARLVSLIPDARTSSFERRILVMARDDHDGHFLPRTMQHLTPAQISCYTEVMSAATAQSLGDATESN